MTKINAIAPILTLKGGVIKNGEEVLTVGECISTILLNDPGKTNRMKMYNLAQKFYNDEFVTLDSADKEMIRSSIDSTAAYNNLVVGQLMEMLISSAE